MESVTLISSSPVSVYSSNNYKLTYSGYPTLGFLRENNQPAYSIDFISSSTGFIYSFASTNIGKESLEFSLSSMGLDGSDVLDFNIS